MKETQAQIVSSREQNLILKNRESLFVSGIQDVGSFDENTISVYTNTGCLKIKGENLNIKKISVESGELDVEGKINGILYIDEDNKPKGLFKRLLK